MYLPKTYKPYEKRACLLWIGGVIKVFTLSRPIFYRVQCKFEDPFSAGRLASRRLTTLYVCRHEWSAHAHKFAAPWVLSFGCCRRKKDFLLNIWCPIVHVLFHRPYPGLNWRVCVDKLYKRSKFQLNRMKNTGVIRGQSFRHSLPTLDCKFEPNVTFTHLDETGAKRKVCINESPGPSAQNFLSPLFRVMAPESWYLLMFDP